MTDKEKQMMGEAIAEKITGSVADHARELGVSRQYLNNIIKGRKVPSGDVMLRIQHHFNLSADILLPHAANHG